MALAISRRDLLNVGYGTAAALSVSAVAAGLAPTRALAQGPTEPKEELFYREDWFGEPWRKPEVAVLIHGNDESSIVWYGWVPRMAQEFRLLRPDLPDFGQSRIPAGFQWVPPSPSRVISHRLL